MSDVLFFHTPEGGDVEVSEGGVDLTMTTGEETAQYLALFGGPTYGAWWGDLLDGEKLKSKTLQLYASGAAITPANLAKYREAVKEDLQDFDVQAIEVSIVSPKQIKIVVDGKVLYIGGIGE